MYGVTFLAVAPTHPVIAAAAEMEASVRAEVEQLAADVASASIDQPVDRAVDTGLPVENPP